MANAINSLNFGNNIYTFTLPYGTCSTAAGTAAKTVDVDNFSLETGARVLVKFTVTNTAASPTLNVESTGAKAIYYNGAAITAGYLKANKTYEFVYNGTQWDMISDVDTNTTYTFNGAVSTIKDSNLEASRALVSNGNGKVWYSAVTSTELGYLDGVTSNVQTQLDGKSASGHTHNYAGSSSAGGAATSANKVNSSLTVQLNGGTTEGTNKFTFDGSGAKSVNITPSAIGAAASSHSHSSYVNQNAFSNVTVGSTTIAADTTTDTLTLVAGSNVTITPDATNDKITIAATDTVYTHPTTAGNKHIPSGGSSGQFLKWSASGTATWAADNDTKNTAGSTDSSSKLFLIGATSQAANPRTYSHDTAYVGTDGCLYSNSTKVSVEGHTHSGYAASSHNHSASNITSGTLAVARGGTGNSNGYIQIGALSGTTVGTLATAEGRNVTASGSYCHAEGNYTEASGSSAHAEGQSSTASGIASHAEGNNATASGNHSHAEGDFTTASAKGAHVEGTYTLASSEYQHVQGKFNVEDKAGTYAHIVGNGESTSARSNAHTLDWAGNAWYAGDVYVGGTSQDDGIRLIKSTDIAGSAANSVALNNNNTSSGEYAVASGHGTIASGYASNAEGIATDATNEATHAEGYSTTASGYAAHAEGHTTVASGDDSHAEGWGTVADGDFQHVEGKWNIKDTTDTYAHIVGNGTSDTARSNAHTVDWNGNAWYKGEVYVGGTDQSTGQRLLKTFVCNARGSTSSLSLTPMVITQVTLDTWISRTNTSFTFSNGGIKCPVAGTVRILGGVYMHGGASQGAGGAYIYKNSAEITSTYLLSPNAVLAETVVNVAAGDIIYLKARAAVASTCVPNNVATQLSIQYI